MKRFIAWTIVFLISFAMGWVITKFVAPVSLIVYLASLILCGWIISRIVLWFEKKTGEELL